MQNEITELRNQVRTLKRIVCLVCCFSLVFVVLGCTNRLTVSEHFDKNVYDSAIVVTTGLALSDIDAQRLFKKLGYKVLRQNEQNYDKKKTLHCSITTGFSVHNLSEYEVKVTHYDSNRRKWGLGNPYASVLLVDCQVEFFSLKSLDKVSYKNDFFNRIYKKLKPILDITKN